MLFIHRASAVYIGEENITDSDLAIIEEVELNREVRLFLSRYLVPLFFVRNSSKILIF